jgi:hypothetical protein
LAQGKAIPAGDVVSAPGRQGNALETARNSSAHAATAIASSAPAFAASAENARRQSSVVNDHNVMMMPVVMVVVVDDHNLVCKSCHRGERNGGSQQSRSNKFLQHRFILCFRSRGNAAVPGRLSAADP